MINLASVLEVKDFTLEEMKLVKWHMEVDPRITFANMDSDERDVDGALLISYEDTGRIYRYDTNKGQVSTGNRIVKSAVGEAIANRKVTHYGIYADVGEASEAFSTKELIDYFLTTISGGEGLMRSYLEEQIIAMTISEERKPAEKISRRSL